MTIKACSKKTNISNYKTQNKNTSLKLTMINRIPCTTRSTIGFRIGGVMGC